mmetsp:Transcript_29780/g.53880  ORF Transcript_29780/g.53880 Transcript_29780/m.53880 type:complete len:216 (-) Transcript_29780:788-1435(-)
MTFLTAPPSAAPITSPGSDETTVKEPKWIYEKTDSFGEHFTLPEWEDHPENKNEHEGYREKNGWKGRDYLHCKSAPVRIADYFISYSNGHGVVGLDKGGVGTVLTGIVHFTEKAESHQGLCHGGSMCSVFDDAIGWCAMFVTGTCQPWSGFTVRVNTSLKSPIRVSSILLVKATIVNVERRKVSIQVELMDPSDDTIHAEGEGLVVMNKGVLPGH